MNFGSKQIIFNNMKLVEFSQKSAVLTISSGFNSPYYQWLGGYYKKPWGLGVPEHGGHNKECLEFFILPQSFFREHSGSLTYYKGSRGSILARQCLI